MSRGWLKAKWGGIRDLISSREGWYDILQVSQFACSLLLAVLCFFTPCIPEEHAIALTLALIIGAVTLSLIVSIFVLAPSGYIEIIFSRLHTSVRVHVGDLFDEADADLVVGFSDCFDTDICDDTIIAPKSVQGQFTKKFYSGNSEMLSNDLEDALAEMRMSGKAHYQMEETKPFGNKTRYDLPVTPRLRIGERNIYCPAYTRMGNNKRTDSDLNTFWCCLNDLWKTIDGVSRESAVAMTVIGTDRARLGTCINDQTMLQLILSSFHANVELGSKCAKLIIVIHPSNRKNYNLVSLKAFLRSLG